MNRLQLKRGVLQPLALHRLGFIEMARSLLFLCALALASCRGAQNRAGDSARPTARDTLASLTEALAPNAVLPVSRDSMLTDSGACPGECCMFGRWGAKTAVTLRTAPDSAAGIVGKIAPGTVVQALTGILFVRPARLVLHRRLDTIPATGEPMPYALVPGDTVLLYTYMGEGFYRARRPATSDTLAHLQFDTPGFGCEGGRRPCDGHFVTKAFQRWWVQIAAPSGVVGWTIPERQFAIMEGCAAEAFPDTTARLQN